MEASRWILTVTYIILVYVKIVTELTSLADEGSDTWLRHTHDRKQKFEGLVQNYFNYLILYKQLQ